MNKLKNFHKKYSNILLFGHGTYLNRGCEAIVTGTANSIKRYDKNSSISVSTFDIANDSKMHREIIDKYLTHRWPSDITDDNELSKIKSLENNRIKEEEFLHKDVINRIKEFDICLSIGGDNYCYGTPYWLYAIDNAVSKNRKRLILWGASIEENIVDRNFITDIRKFDLIIVRESLTFNLLSRYVDRKKILLEPDIAFSLEKKEVTLPKELTDSKGIIGLNISPLVVKHRGENGKLLKDVKNLIDHILEKYPFDILLIPHVYKKNNDDSETAREIKKIYFSNRRVVLLDEKKYSSNELKYVISKCRMLIASRTHASIAGYSNEIPTLVLGYSVKSKGIAKDIFGNYANYVIPVKELHTEILIEKFEYILKNEKSITETLSKIIPEYRKRASGLFETAIKRLEENESIDITKKEKCSGCSACANICPQNAITMEIDEEGFSYPKINQAKCSVCDLCKTICPNNSNYKNDTSDPPAYACKNLSRKVTEKSSSGGIFSLLAEDVLKRNGCVFGAAFDNDIGDVKHIKITSAIELERLRGSKYVESTIGNCYKEAKNELDLGNIVLFSGVPCQIEGLRRFLRKNYENLLCVSVACHGVPSKKVFRSNIKEIESSQEEKIKKINFRDKEEGWQNYKIAYNFEGSTIKRSRRDDPYMHGFLNNYFLRPSCYECDFRLFNKNTSDIILGDFWGVEKEMNDFNCKEGVSAVILNSQKGIEFFEKISQEVEKREISVDSFIKYNSCLIKSVEYNEKRFEFFRFFEKLGLNDTISIFRKDETISALKNSVDETEKDSDEKNIELELRKLKNSRKWKLVNRASMVFGKIFPHGTLRRKVLRVSYKGVSHIYNDLLNQNGK